MKKRGLAPVIIILIVLGAMALGGSGYYIGQKSGLIPSNGKSDILPPLVGNDRDEHGCIGSAGYSWCEAKQKCLRVWEEKCETKTAPTAGVEDWQIYRDETRSVEFAYPKSWTYQKFSCNLDGMAFCPTNNKLGQFNCEMTCSPETKTSPIYFYYKGTPSSTAEDLKLKDKNYSEIYNYMVSTFRIIKTTTDKAKLFIENLQKNLNISYPITEYTKAIYFPGEIKKNLNGFVFYPLYETKLDQYFRSKMQVDGYNSGDGTFVGSMAYKNESVICVDYKKISGDESCLSLATAPQCSKYREVFCGEI